MLQTLTDVSDDSEFNSSTASDSGGHSKHFLDRVLDSAVVGRHFFKSNTSAKDDHIYSEYVYSAIAKSYSSAFAFAVVCGYLSYLALELSLTGSVAIIAMLGLSSAGLRIFLKLRFAKGGLEQPATRKGAHLTLLLASLAGSCMWAASMLLVYPELGTDQRTVFMLLIIGSLTVGAGFLALVPPAYLVHLVIITVSFLAANWMHPSSTSAILSVLMCVFAVELFRSMYDTNASSFKLARRLAKAETHNAHRQNQLQEQIIENHLKVEATLRASTESKNLFLAKISHEFRSPLQVITGSIDLLDDVLGQHIDPLVVSTTQSLNAAAAQLLTTANDLSDYLRTNSTFIKLKPESVELVEVLRSCMAMHQQQAKKKGIGLQFTPAEPSIPCYVDVARLNQILTNLLSNAVKYTQTGYVGLSCSRADDGRVTIVVRDSGVGISEAGLQSIFEPWFRADGRKEQGFGLGLAIVKATADAIGAKIEIDSKIGVGTEVQLQLPPPRVQRKQP